MPLMTSLTNVCEPNPTATPTMPAPAIKGRSRRPTPRATISTATTASTTKATLRKIGRSVRSRASPDRRLAPRQVRCLGSFEPAVDERLQHLPDQIGDEKDHDTGQRAAQQARQEGVATGHFHKINVPRVGKQEDRTGNQKCPDATVEIDRREAPSRGCFSSIPRPRNMTARPLGDHDRRRQEERDGGEPEQAHQSPNPKTPDQNQEDG